MGEISKEEMMTMIDVMSKNNQHLETIANSFRTTCEELKEINARLHNGLAKEISDEVKEAIALCHKEVAREHDDLKILNKDIKEDTSTIEENIKFTKWFVGISSLVIIVATVVLRGIDNRSFLSNTIESQVKATIENEFKVQVPLPLQREFNNSRNKDLGS